MITRTAMSQQRYKNIKRDAAMLLLLRTLLRDGKQDMDHSTLENEATLFL
jgi:hypothetical protein